MCHSAAATPTDTHTGKEQVREKGGGKGRHASTIAPVTVPRLQGKASSCPKDQKPPTPKNRDQTKPGWWRGVCRRAKVISGGEQEVGVRGSDSSGGLQWRPKPSWGLRPRWKPTECRHRCQRCPEVVASRGLQQSLGPSGGQQAKAETLWGLAGEGFNAGQFRKIWCNLVWCNTI